MRLNAPAEEPYDNSKLIQAFVGPMCAVAEAMPFGDFRRCTRIATQTAQAYTRGVVVNVHPVWLTAGVAIAGGEDLDPATAIATGSCTGSGVAGMWMCAQTNSTVGCQQDEFFMSGDVEQAEGEPSPLRYDFDAPRYLPGEVAVEAYSGGAVVTWELPSQGDVAGFRVLCEEQGSGAAAGEGFDSPGLTAVYDGRHYFTAGNLCEKGPFSVYRTEAQEDGPASCGDGVVQGDEACDDGADNQVEGLCSLGCTLNVGGELHALDWSRVCSAHADWDAGMVTVEGLENGVAYNLVLVAYDERGNPRAVPRVLAVTPDASLAPVPTTEEGCGCRSAGAPGGLLLVVGLLCGRRRRR